MRTRHSSRLETVYKGSPGNKKQPDLLSPIEVTGDLVECPVCHAGVRSVLACYTDTANGISEHNTRVYGSHREGGRKIDMECHV